MSTSDSTPPADETSVTFERWVDSQWAQLRGYYESRATSEVLNGVAVEVIGYRVAALQRDGIDPGLMGRRWMGR